MALTIREKKLAVMWLAESAVVDYTCKELGLIVTEARQKHRRNLRENVRHSFSASEWMEIEELDKQIPKE